MATKRLQDQETGLFYDVEIDDTPEPPAKDDKSDSAWKTMRTKADKADLLERENAFLKAGINPLDKDAPGITQYFVDAYRGDLTVEAITKAAVAANILKPEPDPGAPPVQTPDPTALNPETEALAAAGRAAALATGTISGQEPDPRQALIDSARSSSDPNAIVDAARKLGVPIRMAD